MEMIVPVVINDIVSRLISKIVHTYQERQNVGQKLRRLYQTLLKIHASIEEAEQRIITNQLILQQLKIFTETAWQGYYLLDTFESQSTTEEDSRRSTGDEVRNVYSSAVSSFNPCKRIRMMPRSVRRLLFGDEDMLKLEEVMILLDSVAADLREFNALVGGYPRRRLHDAYLLVDKCMFGRHIEREQIINFLIQEDGDDNSLAVLPIIGRHRSGKKTLMENVCHDERVRGHFSYISALDGDDLEGEMLDAPFLSWREGAVITNHGIQVKRLLFVIEFALSFDMESWRKFHHRVGKLMKGTGSKIVVISSLEEVARVGSTSPILLKPLPPEQFWYFFKAIAFGGANPKEHHPRLLSLGMEIAAALDGGFIRAHKYGSYLRANLNVGAWSNISRLAKQVQKGYYDPELNNRIISLHTIGGTEPSRSCVFRRSRMDIAHRSKKLPELLIHDLLTPKVSTIPAGEPFELIMCRSILPPYRIFVATFVNLDASAEKKPSFAFAANETLDDMEDRIFRNYY